MIRKPALISGLASSSLTVSGLVGALLSIEKPKVTFKSQLIKQGYKEVATNKLGPKIILLKQYSDFPQEEITNLFDWCEKGKKRLDSDVDELFEKRFKEYCFETIASKIHGKEFLILTFSTEEQDADQSEWNESFEKFKKAYASGSLRKPSDKWKTTADLTEFKKQCKTNERSTFIDENDEIFKEVKEYCTRKLG